VRIPDAAPTIMSFNASTGGSSNFTGNSTKFLQVINNSLNMSNSNFTISWWQKSIVAQSLYPRILQFGHGHEYTDKFAISEENDGNIYLWINGMNITSIANPNPESAAWNHIAITRNGFDYSWFLNGIFINTTYFESRMPAYDPSVLGGQIPMRAEYDTTGLDLLIGAGDDADTGGFTGNLAGMQISQTVRWETSTAFSPPINFLTPGTGLAFSMYVGDESSSWAVIDKSGNNLTVVPIVTSFGELADDFDPPAPTPDPSPSPDPIDWSQYPSNIDTEDQYFSWNAQYYISKDSLAPHYDYRLIKTISIGVPVRYLDPNSQVVNIVCYLKIPDDYLRVNLDESLAVEFFGFGELRDSLSECITVHDSDHPNGYTVPEYQFGMFGETQTAVSIYLWNEVSVPDFTTTENAFEEIKININLPPVISGHTISRAEDFETDINVLHRSDVIHFSFVTTQQIERLSYRIHVPEAFNVGEEPNDTNGCWINIEGINGVFGESLTVLSASEISEFCHTEAGFTGDWVYDESVSRTIFVEVEDFQGNYIPEYELTLAAETPFDWSPYPSRIFLPGSNFTAWGTTYYVRKDESAPYFDYHRVKHVSFGVPVTYLDQNAIRVNTMCYWQIPDEFFSINSYNILNVHLPGFEAIALNILSICNSNIPDYQHRMLGETQTAVSVYLWTQETVTAYSEIDKAFEALHLNINLPPEILSHTIIRVGTSELSINTVHSGDIIHFNIANSQNFKDMYLMVSVPESSYLGDIPDIDNVCFRVIEANVNGVFGESFTVPSASEISTQCHLTFDGDWTLDESVSRSISVLAYDAENNVVPYQLTLAAQSPPALAPPPQDPTPPPKKPAPPTLELPAPSPVSTPSAPTPAPIVIAPEPVVIASEPVVVEVVVPVAVTESVKIEVVTEVSVESELPSAAKPIKIALAAKACIKSGVWIFTKNNLLQICDTKLKPVLVIPACTGKKATPTYPWLFKAQRFKPGYSLSQSGQKLFYSVFFFKGLAIAGVDKVSNSPCSNGSVFIEKKYAKQVYTYIAKNKSLIWVKS
jgi:hypothetical protein